MKGALELLREMRTAQSVRVGTPLTQNHTKDTKLTMAQFAVSGRCLRIWSAVLREEVVLAADNAEIGELSYGTVVYRARELVELSDATPAGLCLLHETKKLFGGEVLPASKARQSKRQEE